jgi:hypothetical protein
MLSMMVLSCGLCQLACKKSSHMHAWCRLFSRFAEAVSPDGGSPTPKSPALTQHADILDVPLWQLMRTPQTLSAAEQRRMMPPPSDVRLHSSMPSSELLQ